MESPKERIVFPLDLPSTGQAVSYIRRLNGLVGLFKVGLELFIEAGPEIIREIHRSGDAGVFLDLKLHDIPTTVKRAMSRIAGLGVSLATIHCGDDPAMLHAAVEGSGGKVGVLGVTVLTSVSGETIRNVYAMDLSRLVMARAETAQAAGCAGVVCSALEAASVKDRFGKGFLAVTPGIRPRWERSSPDDQARVTTPEAAVRSGADYLVIGRPIRDAPDPAEAARRIAVEIAGAL